MKLYLMRHAEAEDGVNDAARALTDYGRKQAREMARFLANSGIRFDAAYTSPLVRAVQTCEEVLPITNPKPRLKLKTIDILINESSGIEFMNWVRKHPPAEHLLLVGHAPSLAEHVARLTGGSAVKMTKGCVACVDTPDRREGALRFLVSPKLIGCRE